MGYLSKSPHCRCCGEEITFIKTVKGKSMPVNPESVYFVPAGGPNTYVMIDGSIRRGREPRPDDRATIIGFISHFATCPEADRLRNQRERSGTE